MPILLLSAALLGIAPPVHGQTQPAPPSPTVVIVYFPVDVTVLTPEAQAKLDTAVAAYRGSETVNVMIAGSPEPSRSSASCCVGLSQRRSNLVRHYLEAADVRGQDIVIEAFGERQTRPDHARILITFGPGSGW